MVFSKLESGENNNVGEREKQGLMVKYNKQYLEMVKRSTSKTLLKHIALRLQPNIQNIQIAKLCYLDFD